MTWTDRAACKGLPTRIFFPERGQTAALAKQICARCDVRDQCAAAGAQEARGVWGGTSPVDRGNVSGGWGEPNRIHHVDVCPQCDRRHWVHYARMKAGDPCPTCRATKVA